MPHFLYFVCPLSTFLRASCSSTRPFQTFLQTLAPSFFSAIVPGHLAFLCFMQWNLLLFLAFLNAMLSVHFCLISFQFLHVLSNPRNGNNSQQIPGRQQRFLQRGDGAHAYIYIYTYLYTLVIMKLQYGTHRVIE